MPEDRNVRPSLSLPLAVALTAAVSPSAFAGPLTAATILSDFNAVIYRNGTTQSDIEGAAAIGGNFSGATVFNNPAAGQSQPNGFGALTVFGNTSGNPLNLDNGASAYVGGTKGATVNFNSGSSGKGSYLSSVPDVLADFETPLNALSTTLAGLAATGSLPAAANNEVITAAPGTNGIAVIDTTAAALDSIPSFSINLGSASTLVVNVSGASIDFTANDENAISAAHNVIWNFYQANSVTLPDQIGGTVLATGANVSNGNQIDGDLIAASWTGSGELHDYAFTGTLPGTSTPVPEPGSLSLVGAGLAGLAAVGVMLRRFRKPATRG
jgi:choice-of-anchor A domain-containing protein